MKNLLSVVLLFFVIFKSYNQKISKKLPSAWISTVEIKESSKEKTGASEYLLIDYQDNIATQEMYANFAIKVLNSEGIQEFSDITVSFDPSFQELYFNKIQIIRNETIIDKLPAADIKSFQRENDLERSLYDGSITAVINLKDIRKGDIITYAYTIKGFNPVNKGNYSTVAYQQYTLPVNTIYNRIVTTNKLPLYLKRLNNAKEAKTINTDNGIEYIWKIDGTDFYQYDVNTPYWLNRQKRVSVSTFKDWSSLSNLLLPYYQTNKTPIKINDIKAKNSISKEDEILESIRFVQDDVRYLGFESGIGAYKPNDPKKILNQRYGDCKDKSLLLVKLLRQKGVTSFPFLVNTSSKGDLEGILPGLNAFDHCIVYFEHGGSNFYVDPTVTNQGGNLEHLSFPKYSNGLLLKPHTKNLTAINTETNVPSLKIEETITTDSIGGGAIFLIKSTYTGSKANQIRDYYKSNTKESIDNEFLNFYSSIYPSISKSQPVRFTDNSRNGTNEVVVEEYYDIETFWTKDENNFYVCETQPVVLESLISYTNSPKRTLPYYLGNPNNFEQETTIRLPESWNVNESTFKLDEESFYYSNQIKEIGKTIKITHKYQLKTETIAPEKVIAFLANHEKINNQIAYQISHLDQNDNGASGSLWIPIVILCSVLIIGLIGAKKIYEEYNPPALVDATNLSIGGWLIFPTIGLVLSPFILGFQMITQGYFESYTWIAFENSGYENATMMTAFLGVEFAINIAFLIFTILLIILLFNKRTCFPKLILFFYAFNVIVPILDLIAYQLIFPDEIVNTDDNNETFKEIGKAIIGAAIWIPYFLNSERVKNTFTKTYPSKKADYPFITKT